MEFKKVMRGRGRMKSLGGTVYVKNNTESLGRVVIPSGLGVITRNVVVL